MKIDSSGSARSSTSVRRGERPSGARSGEFARHLDSPAAAAGVSGGSPVSTVNVILSLQEVDDPLTGRAQARRRGEELLDRLDELRDGLLAGRLSHASIAALAESVRARRIGSADPKLQEVLDEIELRAAVELAKLDSRVGRR